MDRVICLLLTALGTTSSLLLSLASHHCDPRGKPCLNKNLSQSVREPNLLRQVACPVSRSSNGQKTAYYQTHDPCSSFTCSRSTLPERCQPEQGGMTLSSQHGEGKLLPKPGTISKMRKTKATYPKSGETGAGVERTSRPSSNQCCNNCIAIITEHILTGC